MKRLASFTFGVLFAGMLVSCATPASVPPTVTPTSIPPSATPTTIPPTVTLAPVPTPAVSRLKPGDKIGDMVLTTSQGESMTEIWEYCDPLVTEPGVFTRECQVPAIPDLVIGYGIFADTTGELDAALAAMTWELTLDDHPVNLSAFGTLDRDDVLDGRPIKLRLWNVVLHQPTPGKHTLRYVCNESGKPTDVTWVFTVAGKKTYPTPSSAVSPGQHPYTSQLAHVNFLLYLPNEYGKDARQEWPLILYLHGRGERGYDLEVLKKQPLPEMLEQKADFPFIVVSPQLSPEKDSWSDMVDSLNILLDEVQKVCTVDSQRIYLTGISMGGAGTWEFGLRYPGRFAALVPIAGSYHFDPHEVPDNICDLRDVPIWVFHGSSDTTVPPLGSEVLVDALKDCGGNVRFTLYPNADHEDSWRQAYADPELYTWLLSRTAFTLATSAKEIAGTWVAGNYYIRFNEDGTFRQAHALDKLDSQPYALNSYQFEGTKIVITEVSVSGVPTCGKKSGSYEIRMLESGNIRIVVIEDQCAPRAGELAGEYEPVR